MLADERQITRTKVVLKVSYLHPVLIYPPILNRRELWRRPQVSNKDVRATG